MISSKFELETDLTIHKRNLVINFKMLDLKKNFFMNSNIIVILRILPKFEL